MRISSNLNSRPIAIGVDVTGKLKVKASVAGTGSTAPGTAYKLIFDDYGWTATTFTVSTYAVSTAASTTQILVHKNFYIGIAEGKVTAGVASRPGTLSQAFEFVIAGPTIFQSTLAAGTTGQGLYYTTDGAIGAMGATFAGYPFEFAVFRAAWDPRTNGYTTSPLLSTKDEQYGAMSTGTQAIMLTGMMVSQQ